MSQLPIREFDAKRLGALASGLSYQGVLVETEEQLHAVVSRLHTLNPSGTRVVKPDQLFGKRGKYGLVGVKLNAQGVKDWLVAHWSKEVSINGVVDHLDTFLIEPFVPHEEEWYISLSTERDTDLIRFSATGGMDIEENWESVHEVRVGVLDELDDIQLNELLGSNIRNGIEEIKAFIRDFFQFFRACGFVSLEVNPFVRDASGIIHCLDMVAKVDSCEARKQKERTTNISRVKPFGTNLYPSETIVESVDEKTGASLKLTIINPTGRLWFLLGGGGASVIVMDTLAQRGLLDEVANYGELSGNPDEESNSAYVTTLIETMLANGKSKQYFCLIGGIANFTDIVALVKPLCRVLRNYASVLVERDITVVMRRGGLRVEQAMKLLKTTCDELGIKYIMQDDEHGLTEIFDEIKL